MLVAAPASARSVPRGWLGAQADGPLTELGNPFGSEFDLMRSSGVEAVRTAFDWRAAQPDENGPIDFAPMDAVVVAAAQRGLPLLPVVHRTPSGRRRTRARARRPTPQGTATYTPFLTALVGRYGPSGSLWAEHPALPRPPIRDWQIWNEPN